MFRKLHLQMTVFSTLITSAILVVMTLACLLISENGTKKNSYITFSNNVNSCISHLEGQNLLSHQWILQAENAYGIRMEIRDNGQKLFFDKLNPAKQDTLFSEAAEISKEKMGLDPGYLGSISFTKKELFQTGSYYGAAALIPKGDGVLSAVIVYPLENLKQQLVSQRIAFCGMSCLAILAMAVFSWFFTKKMIHPLEESRKRQTEFIAAASHELRSPLTVILSEVQSIENADEKEREKFLSVIKNEGDRMARLINDMLSLANADNQSWSILLSPCELDTLVLDTYEKYQPVLEEKGIRLFVKIPETALEPFRCDASRISQMLSIFLDNAASYVPEGGKVWLDLKEEEKGFCLSVCDNGPGIPDEDKKCVFQRFYRADTARGNKQHFGLGLCIASEIVSLHHGSIEVTDTPGGGATFRIHLPV